MGNRDGESGGQAGGESRILAAVSSASSNGPEIQRLLRGVRSPSLRAVAFLFVMSPPKPRAIQGRSYIPHLPCSFVAAIVSSHTLSSDSAAGGGGSYPSELGGVGVCEVKCLSFLEVRLFLSLVPGAHGHGVIELSRCVGVSVASCTDPTGRRRRRLAASSAGP